VSTVTARTTDDRGGSLTGAHVGSPSSAPRVWGGSREMLVRPV